MSHIGAFEAKTHLPQLLRRVSAGERFVITRHGSPVAELIPFRPADTDKVRGRHRRPEGLSGDALSRRTLDSRHDRRRSRPLMSFVLDCSVAMSWVFPDEATEATDQLRESLVDGRAFVPALWPIEVANVLLVATRRRRIDRTEWSRISRNLEALPLVIDPRIDKPSLGRGVGHRPRPPALRLRRHVPGTGDSHATAAGHAGPRARHRRTRRRGRGADRHPAGMDPAPTPLRPESAPPPPRS